MAGWCPYTPKPARRRRCCLFLHLDQANVLLLGIVLDDGPTDLLEEVHLFGEGSSSRGIAMVELGSVGLSFAVSFGCRLVRSGLGCLVWDVKAFIPPKGACVEHYKEFKPCVPRHLVVVIHRMGGRAFQLV